MFGQIEITDQPELTKLPQRAASAASILNDMVGASYKVTNYIGSQIVKGVNYIFFAQQTLATANSERHIVKVTINEFDGNYSIVDITRII